MYEFRTPTVKEGPTGFSRLDQFYTYDKGVSVLKINGVYIEKRYPISNELAEADVAYVGGHVYTVTDDEAADLTAAGYADYLTEII